MFAAENHAAARAAQAFVGGCSHNIEARVQRIGQHVGRNHARYVRYVRHGQRTYFSGYRPEGRIVVLPWIRRVSAENDLRLALQGQFAHFVEVDGARLIRPGLVPDEIEDLPHVRYRSAMGQVSSMGEVHAQDRIARFHEG